MGQVKGEGQTVYFKHSGKDVFLMKGQISTDSIFLVSQDTGEKISLKGVKQIDTEELTSPINDIPINDIKEGMKLSKGVEFTFTVKGFKTDEKFKRLKDVEVRKHHLYSLEKKMKRNIEIAELMGFGTIESEIVIKCIKIELEMLGCVNNGNARIY